MSSVTPSTKRYVFVCVVCQKLADSNRKDTLTCSPSCRVRAHRNGSLKTLHALAKGFDIHPANIQQVHAIRQLSPELEQEIKAGRLTIKNAMPTVSAAFTRLVMQLASERTP